MVNTQKTLCLALSGGGAWGIAHIGFLKVLCREKIKVHSICGTSFGGLVGAALATGITPQKLEKEALKIAQTRELMKLLDPNPLRRGFLEGNRVKSYIEKLLGPDHLFENLIFPLKVVAVDLISGQEVVLDSGDLLPAVYATIAIPGVFNPVDYHNQILVDGGTLNNLPVDHARKMGADIVIAVNVHPVVGAENPWNFTHASKRLIPDALISMYRAEIIQSNQLTKDKVRNFPPDLLIQPEIPDRIDSLFGFRQAAEILAAGEKAALNSIDRIKSILLK